MIHVGLSTLAVLFACTCHSKPDTAPTDDSDEEAESDSVSDDSTDTTGSVETGWVPGGAPLSCDPTIESTCRMEAIDAPIGFETISIPDGVGDVSGDGIDDVLTGVGGLYWGPLLPGLYHDSDASVLGIPDLSYLGLGDVNADGIGDVLGLELFFPGPILSFDSSCAAGNATRDGFEISWYHAAPAGDTNGDGVEDVIFGFPYDVTNGCTEGSDGLNYCSGAIIVQEGPITGDIALSSVEGAVFGETPGEQAGLIAASAGDFDGDGLSEVVTSADYLGLPLPHRAGAIFILDGPFTGTALVGELAGTTIVSEHQQNCYSVVGLGDFIYESAATVNDKVGGGSAAADVVR